MARGTNIIAPVRLQLLCPPAQVVLLALGGSVQMHVGGNGLAE
jgi:hypothetical protein